jgi:hypothetical protein
MLKHGAIALALGFAALVPLLTAAAFVLSFGVPPTESYVLAKVLVGGSALLAASWSLASSLMRVPLTLASSLILAAYFLGQLYAWSQSHVPGLNVPAFVYVYCVCALVVSASAAYVCSRLLKQRRASRAEG